MGENKVYTTMSMYPEMANKIIGVKNDLGLKNNSQAIQVLVTAYDIINSTRLGDVFTEAVKEVMERE